MSATCLTCNGEGEIEHPFMQGAYVSSHAENPPDPVIIKCQDCNGTGECDCGLCDSCTTAAENAFSEMCESEPPLSADERHQMAWQQKQELR